MIENRFPALFEARRMLYPRYVEFSDPGRYDQGIAGFLDHVMRHNFVTFVEQASAATGVPVAEIERVNAHGALTPISSEPIAGLDTLLVISFDSTRTGQSVRFRRAQSPIQTGSTRFHPIWR